MKLVLAYCPITTMIHSGDRVFKLLLTKSSEDSTVKVSVDFSKWCQYQRFFLVGPIAREIDAMLGMSPLYASIHLMSQSQWFLFQDSEGGQSRLTMATL